MAQPPGGEPTPVAVAENYGMAEQYVRNIQMGLQQRPHSDPKTEYWHEEVEDVR